MRDSDGFDPFLVPYTDNRCRSTIALSWQQENELQHLFKVTHKKYHANFCSKQLSKYTPIYSVLTHLIVIRGFTPIIPISMMKGKWQPSSNIIESTFKAFSDKCILINTVHGVEIMLINQCKDFHDRKRLTSL